MEILKSSRKLVMNFLVAWLMSVLKTWNFFTASNRVEISVTVWIYIYITVINYQHCCYRICTTSMRFNFFINLTSRLGIRKGIWPVKIEWWGAGMVICLEWSANDLHIVHRVPTHPWKYLNFFLLNSRPWKYFKTGQVLESPWISLNRSLNSPSQGARYQHLR